jgi:hypothetical protein
LGENRDRFDERPSERFDLTEMRAKGKERQTKRSREIPRRQWSGTHEAEVPPMRTCSPRRTTAYLRPKAETSS